MDASAERDFERFYRLHRPELLRWLLSETGDPQTAEDVLQTAFLQAYRAMQRGDAPREPRSWLFAIARNANRGRFRRRRLAESHLDEGAAPAPAGEIDRVHELREALESLPPNQRSAIVLQELGGLSYAEIADRLGLTTGSIQMLVFRARRRLRELLGERRAGAVLPLQSLGSFLSRISGSGEGAVALRGVAAVAGAVAIGGGMLALPGGAPTAQGSAVREGAAGQTTAALVERSVAARPDARPFATAVAAGAAGGRASRTVRADGHRASGLAATDGSAAAAGGAGQAAPAGALAAAAGPAATTAQTVAQGSLPPLSAAGVTVSGAPVPAAQTQLSAPQLGAPQLSAPQVSLPQAPAPEVSAPQVAVPQVSVPQVSVPQVAAPQVSVPQVSTPQLPALPELPPLLPADAQAPLVPATLPTPTPTP